MRVGTHRSLYRRVLRPVARYARYRQFVLNQFVRLLPVPTEVSSVARDQMVTLYSDELTLQEVDELADKRDTTRSTLLFEFVREQLRQEREGAVSAETRAAERLQDLIDGGLTEMEDTARQMQSLNAKTGVYAVAAFELVKQSHGEAAIRKALRTGSRRLREDDLDELASAGDEYGASAEADDETLDGTIDFDALRERSHRR